MLMGQSRQPWMARSSKAAGDMMQSVSRWLQQRWRLSSTSSFHSDHDKMCCAGPSLPMVQRLCTPSTTRSKDDTSKHQQHRCRRQRDGRTSGQPELYRRSSHSCGSSETMLSRSALTWPEGVFPLLHPAQHVMRRRPPCIWSLDAPGLTSSGSMQSAWMQEVQTVNCWWTGSSEASNRLLESGVLT